jgi:hypothetical protein
LDSRGFEGVIEAVLVAVLVAMQSSKIVISVCHIFGGTIGIAIVRIYYDSSHTPENTDEDTLKDVDDCKEENF